MSYLFTSYAAIEFQIGNGNKQLIIEFLIWFLSYVILTITFYAIYAKSDKDQLCLFKKRHVITRIILSFVITITLSVLST